MTDASDADESRSGGPSVDRSDASPGVEPPVEPEEQRPMTDEDGEQLEDEEEIPRSIELIGALGMYLAAGSFLLTAVGLGAISLQIEPFGRAATASSFLGLTVAMLLATINHAYVTDSFVASS